MGAVDLNKRVGINVRRLRLAAGFSQEALADVCDLHRTYVGAVERGERNITLATLAKLAAALRVSPLDLLKEPD